MIKSMNIFTFLCKSLVEGLRELRVIVIKMQRDSQLSILLSSLVPFCSLKYEVRGRSNATELKIGSHYVGLMIMFVSGGPLNRTQGRIRPDLTYK